MCSSPSVALGRYCDVGALLASEFDPLGADVPTAIIGVGSGSLGAAVWGLMGSVSTMGSGTSSSSSSISNNNTQSPSPIKKAQTLQQRQRRRTTGGSSLSMAAAATAAADSALVVGNDGADDELVPAALRRVLCPVQVAGGADLVLANDAAREELFLSFRAAEVCSLCSHAALPLHFLFACLCWPAPCPRLAVHARTSPICTVGSMLAPA